MRNTNQAIGSKSRPTTMDATPQSFGPRKNLQQSSWVQRLRLWNPFTMLVVASMFTLTYLNESGPDQWPLRSLSTCAMSLNVTEIQECFQTNYSRRFAKHTNGKSNRSFCSTAAVIRVLLSAVRAVKLFSVPTAM